MRILKARIFLMAPVVYRIPMIIAARASPTVPPFRNPNQKVFTDETTCVSCEKILLS